MELAVYMSEHDPMKVMSSVAGTLNRTLKIKTLWFIFDINA
jgi:hypothetical protein